ncbi:FAD-dependent oxidoreductase [Rhizobium sp. DKSPLA3]|uniref:FAD-dependent oxidoreductase n=1 Tax=Rhizobium quercicola TaxID=2901226 RepID=A0A9X1NP40_9HYPH|nr:FAD-dependent oxidoreductase [Rhizobium quercicola]MCD7107795.1 FAD-dependent oxidoreductase [Rhizobium quercicola]
MAHFVVVGAGQAGATLVARLRSAGFDGEITLIGEENSPPYQRPPLSKAYLLGEIEASRLWLRAPDFFRDNRITLRLGQRVASVDAEAHILTVGGDRLRFDQLAFTTGAAPRRLPATVGGDLSGVYTLRGLDDVNAMRHRFVAGQRLVIVGGGYIGLEAAAVAAKRGLAVTVVEMAPRILHRVAAPETSDYFRALHAAHGVRIVEGVGLDRLVGDGAVRAARLTDGEEVPADFVIVGIGVLPATELAVQAGCVIENGIRTDAFGETSVPHLWAAGDCASFPHGAIRLRLESVGNAVAHAETVAENMLGAGKAYRPKPWFWSDQYDRKLQIAGLGAGYDRIVTRGSAAGKEMGPESGPASVWYFAGSRLLAVDAINDARAYMVGTRLIEAGKPADPARFETIEDLRQLLA